MNLVPGRLSRFSIVRRKNADLRVILFRNVGWAVEGGDLDLHEIRLLRRKTAPPSKTDRAPLRRRDRGGRITETHFRERSAIQIPLNTVVSLRREN